jgi:signal transduction histidine kinase
MANLSHWSRRLGVLLCVAVALTAATAVRAEARDHKRVLVLFDEDRTFPGLALLDRGLRSTLSAELDADIDFFPESMNLSQFHDEHYDVVLRDYYAKKYHSRQPDLIVAVIGPALTFLLRHGEAIFKGVPIVFCGADAADLQGVTLPPHVTGLLVKRVFGPTLDLALRLQPGAARVYVVGGTSPFDRHLQADARGEFVPFEGRVPIEYLTDQSVPDLLNTVARLPAHSIVLYTSLFRDAAGQAFVPHDVAARLSAAANAPVYVAVDQYVGGGALGGHVYSLERHGELAGSIAARVLRGEPPAAIPVRELASSVTMFDARQLARWRIDTALLPADAVVRFQDPSLWARYKGYVLAATGLLIAQSALIAALLVQRNRRRRAETDLRASFARIRELGGRLLSAQEDERAHIARELHDDFGQQLAVLRIDLEILSRSVRGHDAAVVAEGMKRIEELLSSMRGLSHRLHPFKLQILGLVAALESLRHELSRPGVSIAFTHDEVPPALPPELTLCVFRIAQEALQNSLKHGQARKVSLHLGCEPGGVLLSVEDDGVGFAVDAVARKGKGLGLVSMRERVEAMGGSFDLRSAPGGGTTVAVRVPLSLEQQPERIAV